MAVRLQSPKVLDLNTPKGRPAGINTNILIDSDTTPKALLRKLQSAGNSPLNIRKSICVTRGRSTNFQDESLLSTDDEYFMQPLNPKQHKKATRGRKQGSTSNDHQSQTGLGIISNLLNTQADRLENLIEDSAKKIVNAMENKVNSILQESERRMMDKIN